MRWRTLLVLLGVLVPLGLSVGLMLTSLREDSATWDEVEHLFMGYAYLRGLNPGENLTPWEATPWDQPPLIRAIAAFPPPVS